MRVLVVEDDEEMANAIGIGLRRAEMVVDVALDGKAGLALALVNDYDVIVLDRDLPKLPGDEVCAELVASGQRSRIMMLTAAVAVDDRVQGLNVGADDYLLKPFAFAELVARIRTLTRRSQPAVPPVIRRQDLEIDTGRHVASRDDRSLDLGPKEFGILEVLLSAQGRVVSAEELLERVWDEEADPATTAVKVTLSRLRRKLGDPQIIRTVTKFGAPQKLIQGEC